MKRIALAFLMIGCSQNPIDFPTGQSCATVILINRTGYDAHVGIGIDAWGQFVPLALIDHSNRNATAHPANLPEGTYRLAMRPQESDPWTIGKTITLEAKRYSLTYSNNSLDMDVLTLDPL